MGSNSLSQEPSDTQPDKTQRRHLRGLPRRVVRQNGLSAGLESLEHEEPR